MVGLVALLVLVFQRGTFQIDMHMAFSPARGRGAVVLLAVDPDRGRHRRVHHLALNFISPMPCSRTAPIFSRVLIHAVILIAEAVALVWLTHRLVVAFAESAGATDAARKASGRDRGGIGQGNVISSASRAGTVRRSTRRSPISGAVSSRSWARSA